MAKEATGAVDERPFWGVHILATAMMCANGSSPDELELARRLLAKDPRIDAPRENESIAGAFTRHMDAALDSANDSVGDSSRSARRAKLARDLDRAGVVLIDRAKLAELISIIHELRTERGELLADLARLEPDDLGAELLEPCSNPDCAALDNCLGCGKRAPALLEHQG